MGRPYNPLDERNLAESLVRALLQEPCGPLPPPESFTGAGLYAIYYSGNFAPYAGLATINATACTVPIYVGKASPPGARRGGLDLDAPPGNALYSRLTTHADSIRAATNLRLEDFRCRFLVTTALWLAVGEELLIKRYKPVWNTKVDGFGNHDPGGGRRAQSRRPEWDTLHPGRWWSAEMLDNPRIPVEIGDSVVAYLAETLH